MSHTSVRSAAAQRLPEGAAALDADLDFWARVRQASELLQGASLRERCDARDVSAETLALLAHRLLPLVRERWVKLDSWKGWFPRSGRQIWRLSSTEALGRLFLGADGEVYEVRTQRHERWVNASLAAGGLVAVALGSLLLAGAFGRGELLALLIPLGSWALTSIVFSRWVVPDAEAVRWEEAGIPAGRVAEALGQDLVLGLRALEAAGQKLHEPLAQERAIAALLAGQGGALGTGGE